VQPNTLWISLGTIDMVSSTTGSLQFYNGSRARQWLQVEYQLHWDAVAHLLEQRPGNDGYVMLPWLEPEITPHVAHAGIRRFGFDRRDAFKNVRALVEGQMMAMANHAVDITGDSIDRIVATGSEATNYALLQVMANVFGADVYRLDTDHAAAMGAALRAYQGERLGAGESIDWPAVVSAFIEPHPGHRVSPNPKLVSMYAELRREYAILERLHRGRPPIW
jgi:sugar (pentulose or hexulose) kinase